MHIQWVISGVLILGGLVTVWAGPDYGVREDGQPFNSKERYWVRIFGWTMLAAGIVVLVATLMGFRAPPAQGPVNVWDITQYLIC